LAILRAAAGSRLLGVHRAVHQILARTLPTELDGDGVQLVGLPQTAIDGLFKQRARVSDKLGTLRASKGLLYRLKSERPVKEGLEEALTYSDNVQAARLKQ
jgi:hypothetical protein